MSFWMKQNEKQRIFRFEIGKKFYQLQIVETIRISSYNL